MTAVALPHVDVFGAMLDAFRAVGVAARRAADGMSALLARVFPGRRLPSARTVRLARRARRRHLALLLRQQAQAKRVYAEGARA